MRRIMTRSNNPAPAAIPIIAGTLNSVLLLESLFPDDDGEVSDPDGDGEWCVGGDNLREGGGGEKTWPDDRDGGGGLRGLLLLPPDGGSGDRGGGEPEFWLDGGGEEGGGDDGGGEDGGGGGEGGGDGGDEDGGDDVGDGDSSDDGGGDGVESDCDDIEDRLQWIYIYIRLKWWRNLTVHSKNEPEIIYILHLHILYFDLMMKLKLQKQLLVKMDSNSNVAC